MKKEEADGGCLRPKDIPTSYQIIFEWQLDLDQIIDSCMMDEVKGSKQKSLSYDATETKFTQFYAHYTVITPTFGFMDDFYISAQKIQSEQDTGPVAILAQS